jgi:RHS repeat-associated protein
VSVRRRASGRAHYNYFRDYDPAVGRYVKSDPIGLRAGVNTYAYAKNSPVRFGDPLGLTVLGGVLGGLGADVSTPEPSDVVPWKWVGWGVLIAGAVVCDAILDDDDDEIDCEEYLKLVNQDYNNVLAKEALGVNMEAAKLEHDEMVNTFCMTCPDECPRALRFGRRILH